MQVDSALNKAHGLAVKWTVHFYRDSHAARMNCVLHMAQPLMLIENICQIVLYFWHLPFSWLPSVGQQGS